jgi:hypothetical protein
LPLASKETPEMPEKPPSIDDVIDEFFVLRQMIFDHVGYVEDWRVFPLDDSREMFWTVDEKEHEYVKYSPDRKALVYWLEEHDDEYGQYGRRLYSNVIYTQRHLPKWVYRGKDIVLVVADTQTDGNRNLQLFRVDHEVRLSEIKKAAS